MAKKSEQPRNNILQITDNELKGLLEKRYPNNELKGGLLVIWAMLVMLSAVLFSGEGYTLMVIASILAIAPMWFFLWRRGKAVEKLMGEYKDNAYGNDIPF